MSIMTLISMTVTERDTASADPVEQWYWELVELAYPRSWIVDEFDGRPACKRRTPATVHAISAETVAARLRAIEQESGTPLPAVLQEVLRQADERISEVKKGHGKIDFLLVGLLRSVGEAALAPLSQ